MSLNFNLLKTQVGETMQKIGSAPGVSFWTMWKRSRATPAGPVETPVSMSDVLASDWRLRKRLAARSGNASTILTGGLGNSPTRMTLPTLIGTA